MTHVELCPECGGGGCEMCSWKGTARAWLALRERAERDESTAGQRARRDDDEEWP